jgi:hypothetical protein
MRDALRLVLDAVVYLWLSDDQLETWAIALVQVLPGKAE